MKSQINSARAAIKMKTAALLFSAVVATLGVTTTHVEAGTLGTLIRINKIIYYCVGWEAGRMISIKKYGRAGDPGVCPKGFWLWR
jgi:hypothetical protein